MPVFTATTLPPTSVLFAFHQFVLALNHSARWFCEKYHWICCAAFVDDSDELTDEYLMNCYVDGSSDAFRTLFDRYAPKLLRAAQRKGLSESECQDAVQQTFVHVHQGRFEFDRLAPVAPWIFTIGFNVMRDYGRRFSAHQRLKSAFTVEAQVEEGPALESDPPLSVNKDTVRNAVTSLSDDQREVILLHYYEEMSFADIAKVLGCKPGAVRGRAHRGYKKLRALLRHPTVEVTP